jgi:hypothetical protein
LLEEFLHGTQAKTGVLKRFTLKHGGDVQAVALEAEAYVKKFMVQYRELLRLDPEDVGKLGQLYELECNRLNNTLQRRFK